jgi:putative ABC transport system permease protein
MTRLAMAQPRVGFSRTLWNVGWRHLLRHPWQSVLMVVGILLGVAVVVSIDLANASASRAFELSPRRLRAALRIRSRVGRVDSTKPSIRACGAKA